TTTCYRDLSPPRSFSTTVVTDADGRFTWPDPDPIITDICVFVPPVNVFALKKAGYIFTRTEFVFQPSGSVTVFTPYDDRLPLIQGTAVPPLGNGSAASFGAKPNQPPASLLSSQFIASEMILAGFGVDLAATTETAAGSLPTTLAGRKLLVKDSAG